MGNVMVISAKRQVGNTARQQDAKPRLRVAAYCRVSTDSDEQATSYDAQVEHYTEFIQKNPEWKFAGIYADDGISGTNTKKREDFNRMIDDCEAGNIDMIITKSISRFARNTLASLAQQESQSLSQNVKLGLQFRYQNGQVQVNHNHFLGYTKDANGNLIIDPEQAEVVKRIYREYLEGYSMDRIAKGLEADGILTGAGKTKWWTSTNGKKRSYSCNHCFAQIVICGKCGEMFRRIHWNNHGCKSIVWRCISRLESIGQECHARTVNETVLENMVVQAINTLLGDKSTYQAQLQQNIANVIRSAQQNTADGIDEKLQELQKELLKKPTTKRPTTRLPMKSSSSGSSARNVRLILRPGTHRLPASTNCKISSSSNPHTWKPLMRLW